MYSEIGSTIEEEDLHDCCSVAYRDADPSDLGTLVFVKSCDKDIGDRVVVYTHFDNQDDSYKVALKLKIIMVSIFMSMLTLIITSLILGRIY